MFVANDMLVNQLWLNRGNMRFEDESLLWGCAVDEHGIEKAGMGVAAVDFDNDDDTDLLVVNMEQQTDSFFRNEGSYFVDATRVVGLGASSLRHTRFGVALADLDNDGRLDLYEANGRIESPDPSVLQDFAEPNTLYRGTVESGAFRFEEVMPQGGVSPPLLHTSRGLAVGDVDNDGGVDLLVVNRDAAPYLLMNRAERGNWVRFEVRTASGRDAHGASVSAAVETSACAGMCSRARATSRRATPRVHFGLGGEARIEDVNVTWPGGVTEAFGGFEAGRTHRLVQGLGVPAK